MIPIVIAAGDRRLLDRLAAAGATSAANAVVMGDLSPAERVRLVRLVKEGVVCEPEPGRYHLDAAAWEGYGERERGQVRSILLAVFAIAIVLVLIAVVLAGRAT